MTLKAVIPIFIIVPLLIACVGLVIFCAIKPEYRRVKNFRRISMLVLVLFILMRPAFYTSTSVESSLTNLDIYFVADVTGSMVAKDCGDNHPSLSDPCKQCLTVFCCKSRPHSRYNSLKPSKQDGEQCIRKAAHLWLLKVLSVQSLLSPRWSHWKRSRHRKVSEPLSAGIQWSP